MQTKLTLRLDDGLVEKAKIWARSRQISLSQAVGEFFAQLPVEESAADPALSPWTRRLIGAAAGEGPSPTDEEVREAYRNRLEAKYR